MPPYAPFLIERVQTEAIFSIFIGPHPLPVGHPRRPFAEGVGPMLRRFQGFHDSVKGLLFVSAHIAPPRRVFRLDCL